MIPQNPHRKKNSAYVEIPRKNDNHAFNAFMPSVESQTSVQKTQMQTKSICKTTINTKTTSTNRTAKV